MKNKKKYSLETMAGISFSIFIVLVINLIMYGFYNMTALVNGSSLFLNIFAILIGFTVNITVILTIIAVFKDQ